MSANMAFLDAGSLDDPVAGYIEHLLKISVGVNFSGHIAPYAADPGFTKFHNFDQGTRSVAFGAVLRRMGVAAMTEAPLL